MSTQLRLELKARDRGMTRAAMRNPDWLELFRGIALELPTPLTIDDVRDEAVRRGLCSFPRGIHPGNWLGSVFKRKKDGWRLVGYANARHKGSRARRVGVWTR